MPIGKIAQTSGKGADYSAGSVNIEHGTQTSEFPQISLLVFLRVAHPHVGNL